MKDMETGPCATPDRTEETVGLRSLGLPVRLRPGAHRPETTTEGGADGGATVLLPAHRAKRKRTDPQCSLEERAPARLPVEATDLDMAFGSAGSLIPKFLPPMSSLPEEFQRGRNPWCEFGMRWFYSGLEVAELDQLKPREGVDRQKAIRHVRVCLGSWEPKHEHKEAGVGYLLSIWFEGEPPKASGAKGRRP